MNQYLRRVLVAIMLIAIAPGLGACAALYKANGLSIANPVTNNRIYDIEAGYGVVLTAAKVYVDNYRAGKRCTVQKPESLTNLCSRRSVVIKIQQADANAQVAIAKAKGFILRNPTLDPSSVLDAAQTAVDTLRTINAQNGV